MEFFRSESNEYVQIVTDYEKFIAMFNDQKYRHMYLDLLEGAYFPLEDCLQVKVMKRVKKWSKRPYGHVLQCPDLLRQEKPASKRNDGPLTYNIGDILKEKGFV